MEYKKIGKYELREKRGEGGFGVLYRAFDTIIEREIALKLLHRQLASEEKFSAWFHREAKAMAKLNHPNIVTIYNFEVIEDDHFIVMEYVDGKNVDELLRGNGAFSVSQTCMLGRQILSALGYAHRNGIIHRDIKPSNIMVTQAGLVKITDFGIAKILGSSKLTQTGTAAGSLPYMSPEQIRGKADLDFHTDLYSFGITMYQMLTGQLPFREDSDFLLMKAHMEKAPPRPSDLREDIPRGVEAIILRSLEKEPVNRFESAQDMSQKIADFQKSANLASDDEISLASTVYERETQGRTPQARTEVQEKTELHSAESRQGPRPILYLLGVIAVVVALLGIYQFLIRPGQERQAASLAGEDTITQKTAGQDTIPEKDTTKPARQTEEKTPETGVQEKKPAVTETVQAHAKNNGKLEIYYTPSDYANAAEIYISGIKIPHTEVPVYLDTLKPGRHEILLVSKMQEFANNRFLDTVTVTSTSQAREYSFVGAIGKVRVSASFIGGSPTMWGEIYVDEKKQEVGTPFAFELIEGPHKISVRRDGFETVGGDKYLYLGAEEDIELSFKLRKK